MGTDLIIVFLISCAGTKKDVTTNSGNVQIAIRKFSYALKKDTTQLHDIFLNYTCHISFRATKFQPAFWLREFKTWTVCSLVYRMKKNHS